MPELRVVGDYQGSVLDVPCGVGCVHGDGAIGGAVCDHVQEMIQAGGQRTNKYTVEGMIMWRKEVVGMLYMDEILSNKHVDQWQKYRLKNGIRLEAVYNVVFSVDNQS